MQSEHKSLQHSSSQPQSSGVALSRLQRDVIMHKQKMQAAERRIKEAEEEIQMQRAIIEEQFSILDDLETAIEAITSSRAEKNGAKARRAA